MPQASKNGTMKLLLLTVSVLVAIVGGLIKWAVLPKLDQIAPMYLDVEIIKRDVAEMKDSISRLEGERDARNQEIYFRPDDPAYWQAWRKANGNPD
jgi:hypothetical protein